MERHEKGCLGVGLQQQVTEKEAVRHVATRPMARDAAEQSMPCCNKINCTAPHSFSHNPTSPHYPTSGSTGSCTAYSPTWPMAYDMPHS